ncbi:hypothetical protein DM01DRAFT_1376554 [Hesseltinella vesiculosa]|uniref:Uncharacterized protein n=1 Tax=Hesseltinella vesiculosa TaxID=101127 RepID=A0A1X2G9Q5_9FUNG|nr:hypothetical protein DM01DRAFT_1376554 [Hesseltinella vesiculosa]
MFAAAVFSRFFAGVAPPMPTEPATTTTPTALTTTATSAMLIDAPSNDFALAGEFAMLACACLCGLWLLRMIVSRRSHLGREPSNASVASGCVPLLLPAPLLQRPPLSALPADPWLGARHPGGPRLPQPTKAAKTVDPWLGARSPLPLPVLVCPPLLADPWSDARRPVARSPSPLPRPALPSIPRSAWPEDPWFMHSAATTTTATTTTTVTSAATAATTVTSATTATNVTVVCGPVFLIAPASTKTLSAMSALVMENPSFHARPQWLGNQFEEPGLGNPLKHLGLRTLKTSHQQQRRALHLGLRSLKTSHQQQRRALSGGNLAPPSRQWLGNQFEEPGLGNPLKHLGLRSLKTSHQQQRRASVALMGYDRKLNSLGSLCTKTIPCAQRR